MSSAHECLEHLQWYHTEGDAYLQQFVANNGTWFHHFEPCLQQILAGSESWCHHFEATWISAGMHWVHPTSPPAKEIQVTSIPSKVFFGCILQHCGTRASGLQITSQHICCKPLLSDTSKSAQQKEEKNVCCIVPIPMSPTELINTNWLLYVWECSYVLHTTLSCLHMIFTFGHLK